MDDVRVIDTGTEELIAQVRDRVAIITLNRAHARNAMSREMNSALATVLSEMEQDDGVGAIVLTGAGAGFCAGGDVKAMNRAAKDGGGETAEQKLTRQIENQRATAGKIYRMNKPVIAALPGAAAGAGMSLALACDLRIFAQRAFLNSAFVTIGLSCDYGGTFFLSKLVGMGKAKEIYYLAARLDAQQCLDLGIANWVVDDDKLLDEARIIASKLANGPSLALAHLKESLHDAFDGCALETCLDKEATQHHITRASEDFKEAIDAFTHQRPVKFTGR